MKNNTVTAVLAALLAGFLVLALLDPKISFTSKVTVKAADNLDLIFLQANHLRESACQDAASSVARVVTASCPTCLITVQECLSGRDSETGRYLGNQPLSVPSARAANGTTIYQSRSAEIALSTCQGAEKQTTGTSHQFICDPPNMPRKSGGDTHISTSLTSWKFWLAAFVVPLAFSFLLGWGILRYERLHANWSADHVDTGPQKFHAIPTPRIGGACIAAGLLTCAALLPVLNFRDVGNDITLLLVAGFAPFAGGLAEDLLKAAGVLNRLLFTMIGAAIASWLLGAILPAVDIPGLDMLFAWAPFAIAFTVFAVSGVSNSINIIDGFNGLAGGFSVLVLLSLVYVATQVGDLAIFSASIMLTGALLGFLYWNYPKGRIFLGDGGAYLVGFWLAELSVLLVVRNPAVSPWFPLLLLAYPVFETLFSCYRRVVLRGRSASHPDGLHLHTLLFRRAMGRGARKSVSRTMTQRNNRVAPQMLFISLICFVPALLWWRNSSWLVAGTIFFCLYYSWLYFRITRWRTPRWLHWF